MKVLCSVLAMLRRRLCRLAGSTGVVCVAVETVCVVCSTGSGLPGTVLGCLSGDAGTRSNAGWGRDGVVRVCDRGLLKLGFVEDVAALREYLRGFCWVRVPALREVLRWRILVWCFWDSRSSCFWSRFWRRWRIMKVAIPERAPITPIATPRTREPASINTIARTISGDARYIAACGLTSADVLSS